MVDGPAGRAEAAGQVADQLAGHHRLAAVRGYLLEMAGDRAGALAQLRAAATRTPSSPERRYLLTEIARLNRA